MKNRKLLMIMTALLVLILSVPVFAEDAVSNDTQEVPAAEEIAAEGAIQEEPGTEEQVVDEAAQAGEEKQSSSSEGEKAASEEPETEPVEEKAGDLIFVTEGKGSLSLSDDGSVICTPYAGWEIISITADKDAGSIRAGEQIPEDEIQSIGFSDGTTITAVFEQQMTGDGAMPAPASATAVFG